MGRREDPELVANGNADPLRAYVQADDSTHRPSRRPERRSDQLVHAGESFPDAARIGAAPLRHLRAAAGFPTCHRRDLICDLPGVQASPNQIRTYDDDKRRLLVDYGAEHHDSLVHAIAEPVAGLPQRCHVWNGNLTRQDGGPIHTVGLRGELLDLGTERSMLGLG
jgi:hypothetical protein